MSLPRRDIVVCHFLTVTLPALWLRPCVLKLTLSLPWSLDMCYRSLARARCICLPKHVCLYLRPNKSSRRLRSTAEIGMDGRSSRVGVEEELCWYAKSFVVIAEVEGGRMWDKNGFYYRLAIEDIVSENICVCTGQTVCRNWTMCHIIRDVQNPIFSKCSSIPPWSLVVLLQFRKLNTVNLVIIKTQILFWPLSLYQTGTQKNKSIPHASTKIRSHLISKKTGDQDLVPSWNTSCRSTHKMHVCTVTDMTALYSVYSIYKQKFDILCIIFLSVVALK